MKKRLAQASVVAVVILILLVLASIVIIWNVVKSQVEKESEKIDIEIITVESVIQEGAVFVNKESGDLQLDITRGADKVNLSSFKIVVTGEERNEVYLINSSLYPLPLETKTYHLRIVGLTDIKKISVYPVSLKGRVGREEKYDITEDEPEIPEEEYWKSEIIYPDRFKNLGEELVVNGDFSSDESWVQEGSVFIFINNFAIVHVGPPNLFNLTQSLPIEAGKIYKLNYNVSVFVGSWNLSVSLGGAQGVTRNSTGIFVDYINTVNTDDLRFYSNNVSNYSFLDDVSVKKVLG